MGPCYRCSCFEGLGWQSLASDVGPPWDPVLHAEEKKSLMKNHLINLTGKVEIFCFRPKPKSENRHSFFIFSITKNTSQIFAKKKY